MNTQFIWENFNHPLLKELKHKFLLEKVTFNGIDEYEKQLLLKKWVFDILPLGYNNFNQYTTAIDVLNDKDNTGGFNCTWYVLVYLQCAIALGWYVRKIGIDTYHKFGEEEKRHTIIEIWSNKFNKWYVIDPMFNTHFEKDKIPLNTFEIRNAYLEKDNKVGKITGLKENQKPLRTFKEMHNTSDNYFWFFILLRNNFLVDPNVYNSKAFLWLDKHNKDKTWFVGGKNKGEFKKHPMYDGAFIETSDFDLCYPKMN